ncbi:uncharacterized protein LOC115676154 [Syzygium oleosum]|uniref:uncharacterized protein LOC115676154 n=1 Tax=Syzygium oleosum TaxID=219896 RepID=UPI0024B889A9|nr:uncharacterized protein LOC115676154 [Syzygium oleosum]
MAAKAMASLGMSLLVFLLALVMAEADPGAKLVKCQDKTSPCYHVKQYCPAGCLRTCEVDCASCRPVCTGSNNSDNGSNNGNNNVNNNNNNGNNNVNNNDNNGNNNGNNNDNNNGNNNDNNNNNNNNNNSNGNSNDNNNNNGNNGSGTPTHQPPPPSTPVLVPPPPNSPPTATPPGGGSMPPNAPPTHMPPPSSGSTPPNAPPTTTPPPTQYPPPPPSSEVSGGKRVRCKNRNYPHCYGLEQSCPSACASTCEVDCVTCKTVCSCDNPGAVCQDPRFIGGDGITFYFHGKKNRDFCLVSDTNLHINAHFIGRRNANMHRDFTWVQSLGILFGSHNLFIGALKTSSWDDAIDRLSLYLNGAPITLPQHEGALWHSKTTPRISFTRHRDTNAIKIEVEKNFKIKAMVVPITRKDSLIHNYGITNEDRFAHLDLSFKFYALSSDVSGVLGQTYARNYVSRAKMDVAMPVLGGEREFASSGLFTTDCAASRFIGQLAPRNSTENFEYADLECAGGVEGSGVVCKR